jgi:predicted nucleic acid-binding protein
MIVSIDISVLVAAIIGAESFHAECNSLVAGGGMAIHSHGLAETFSTITGGGRPGRLSAAVTAEILEIHYAPRLTITTLTSAEMMRAMNECENRGVRGGAIYDFLHLVAARKAKAKKLFTLNVRDFRHFHREGDPEIAHP